MLNLANIYKNFKITNNQSQVAASQTPVQAVKNWYEERYNTLIVQRNVVLVLLTICLILSIVAIIVIAVIINSREFDPFVIQVDETTGMAKIVKPTSNGALESDEALSRYFIKKYVTARETYNPVDFDTEARQLIRLFSSAKVYWNYLGYLKNKEVNPSIVYGQRNTTYLLVKSWSKLDAKKYMFRFSINETADNQRVFNKIAIVDFDYVTLELTDAERDINPIGFQVNGYRVDDDNS